MEVSHWANRHGGTSQSIAFDSGLLCYQHGNDIYVAGKVEIKYRINLLHSVKRAIPLQCRLRPHLVTVFVYHESRE